MRKIGVFLLALLCLLGCCVPASAISSQMVYAGCATLQASYALSEEEYSGTAKAALLYELDTQTLVYAYNADEAVDPSGLVKLMTALVVLENADVDEAVTVYQSTLNTLSSGARRVGLLAGDVLTVGDLLYCVMVYSANDAAAVLAAYVGESQEGFVALMNQRAAALGCTDTQFVDAHGLSSSNRSTARDLAIITEEALKHEEFVEMFGAVNYQLPSNLSCTLNLTTTCDLLNENSKYYDSRVTGGKPAKTSGKGSMICTAETENGRYLCVILSTTDRSGYTVTDQEATALLNKGLKGYAVQQVLGCDQPYGLYAVADGENSVTVSPAEDIYALLPLDYDPDLLQFSAKQDAQALTAPLEAGTVVGSLVIRYNGLVIGEAELLARYDVALAGERIQAADSAGGNVFLKILKWTAVVLVILALLAAAGLVALRQINIAKYKKKKAYRRKEESHELE